jgi:hypothetical protein
VFSATSGSASSSAALITVAAGPAFQIVVGDTIDTAGGPGGGLVQGSIGAFVADAASNPVFEGTLVHFELTGANADTADVTTRVPTDESGVAITTITYPTGAAGLTITLRVTVGSITETKDLILPPKP